MLNTELLFEGECVLCIKFPDGSEIQSVTTLNPEILRNLGLNHVDGLVDIITRRDIPMEYLATQEIVITPGRKLTLNPLDRLFQNNIKRRWRTR